MIWIVFAIVTAGAILAVARPLMRAGAEASGVASEIEAYKLQLAELGREEERGTLGKDEAEQTRTEISRRLLRASRQGAASPLWRSGAPLDPGAVFFALAAVIAIGAAALYAEFGSPGLPDQPLEARLNAPVNEQPLAIQIANVERLLRKNPKDALGWTVIAPVYFKTGQFGKAAQAYLKAMRLSGEDEEKLLGFAEAQTLANDGVAPASAKAALDAALSRNPKSLRGRLLLAAVAGQEGRKQDAERIYRDMLAGNIPDALKKFIEKQLAALEAEPGPQGAAGAQASAEAGRSDQGAMIRGMVDRLAERLKANGNDLEGWLKLIRSYAVLKESAKAQEAVASARAQFASEPRALKQIDGLARELGLAPADAKGG